MFLRARLPGALLALLLCIAAPLRCNADATVPATVVYNVPIRAPGWKVKADSQENTRKRKSVASNVLDRDFDTIWHSRWSRNEAPLPHWIKVDMKTGRYNVTGLRCVPSIHVARVQCFHAVAILRVTGLAAHSHPSSAFTCAGTGRALMVAITAASVTTKSLFTPTRRRRGFKLPAARGRMTRCPRKSRGSYRKACVA